MAGKQWQWLGLVIDLRGTLAQRQAPEKESETWPELAGGVAECSRTAGDRVLDMSQASLRQEGLRLNLKLTQTRPKCLGKVLEV